MKIIDVNNSKSLRRIIQFSQLAAAFTILCGTLQAYSSGPPRYSGALEITSARAASAIAT